MDKKALRQSFKSKRSQFSSEQIQNYSIEIANKVLQLPIWDFSFYHIFLSIVKNKEVDTEPLLSLLQGKDKNVVLPKTCSTRVLKNFLLTDDTILKENYLFIPEPIGGIEIPEQQLDVVFVPLLAFDVHGNRVGYGGGYYDTLLKKCRPTTIKIGLSFFEAVAVIDDCNENDIPLNYCVTPQRVYTF